MTFEQVRHKEYDDILARGDVVRYVFAILLTVWDEKLYFLLFVAFSVTLCNLGFKKSMKFQKSQNFVFSKKNFFFEIFQKRDWKEKDDILIRKDALT